MECNRCIKAAILYNTVDHDCAWMASLGRPTAKPIFARYCLPATQPLLLHYELRETGQMGRKLPPLHRLSSRRGAGNNSTRWRLASLNFFPPPGPRPGNDTSHTTS